MFGYINTTFSTVGVDNILMSLGYDGVRKPQCVKTKKTSVSVTRVTNVLLAYGVSISSFSQFDQLITLDHFNSPAPVPAL